MARIPYVEKEGAPDEVAEIFRKMEANGASVMNLWKMAAHSPSTLIHLIRLGNSLLSKTELDARLREIAILRTATLANCEYEVRAHSMYGKEVGMTDEQIKAISDWENSGAFGEVERAVLRFTDEVARNADVTDGTFAEVSGYLNHRTTVELALVVGFYGMLARILVPFAVDLSDEAPESSSQIIGRSGK